MRFPAADYQLVDGESEIVSGVRVVPTPGHTDGHQAVVVDSDEGAVVIAGQVPYDPAEFDHVMTRGELPENHEGDDAASYLRSARRIAALAPVRVHFTHTQEAWVRQPSPRLLRAVTSRDAADRASPHLEESGHACFLVSRD